MPSQLCNTFNCILFLASASVAFFCAGCTDNPPSCRTECGPCSGVVARVIDGDTIELTTGETIRYIGVDTPETTRGKDECFGQEAVEYNKLRVENKNITIEYDKSCTDRFERTLAYVYVDDWMINMDMLELGYGKLLIIAPCDRYEEAMTFAETSAQDNNRGGWGVCDDW